MPRLPCKHGSDTERYSSSGECIQCAKEKKKQSDFDELSLEAKNRSLLLAENRKLRKAASVADEVKFKSVIDCSSCGSNSWYVSTNYCSQCHNACRDSKPRYSCILEEHYKTDFKGMSEDQVIISKAF